MSMGISNSQTENALKNMNVEAIKDNLVGVFPSNHMNKFINHAAMISEKNGKYPFVIAKLSALKRGGRGMQWWSILDTEPKKGIFFFVSFGLDGLKHFITQDDRNVMEKIFGTEKMTITNDNAF